MKNSNSNTHAVVAEMSEAELAEVTGGGLGAWLCVAATELGLAGLAAASTGIGAPVGAAALVVAGVGLAAGAAVTAMEG